MKFSIVYNKSGDTIPFVALGPGTFEMLEYYVQNLDDKSLNTFKTSAESDLAAKCKELRDCITDVNSFIYPFIETEITELHNNEDCLDQYVLNKLHADWVNSQSLEYNFIDKKERYSNSDLVTEVCKLFPDDIPVAPVSSVLSRLGLDKRYGKLNQDVHNVEVLFNRINYQAADTDWIQIDNPFSKALATNDICHFNIKFNHLGRPLCGKFETFDMNLEHNDENSFNELLGYVTISLKQPETIPFSKEYIAWCNEHDKIPSSRNIGIGNVVDIQDNLTKYRKVMYRNINDANTFSIVIN